ncbi:MAG: DEAD/DEAH box helicase family protein, partial [bacterium]
MIKLYDYEKEFLSLINAAFAKSARVLAAIATGLGKTIIAAFWAKEQIKNGRGLVLCDNNEILEQDLKSFR